MPKKTKVLPMAGISLADLAYAVGRLMELGHTTPKEIAVLASQRGQRIRNLEQELAALRKGLLPAGDLAGRRPAAAKAKAAPKAKPAKKTKAAPKAVPSRKTTSKKMATRTAPPANAPQKGRKTASKVGQVITRKDGRTFTTTDKVVKARRIQGHYIAYLRKVDPKAREGFKTIAREQGVPAAVEAMQKRLGE
jgi:hypothetical protein